MKRMACFPLVLFCLMSCTKTKQSYTEVTADLNMEMVYVEGGAFMMGATDEQKPMAQADEYPVHETILRSYYIGKFEVTQEQWEKVMGNDLQELRMKAEQGEYVAGEGNNYPMYYVNWEDANAFCERLSEMTGKKYVLPEEAQWEYAARGGRLSKGYRYSGGDTLDYVAWCNQNGGGGTHNVGLKRANELGIFDMSGNVWEWCADQYASYGANVQKKDSLFGGRVVRGGAWYSDATYNRVSARYGESSQERSHNLGFRVVRILEK